MRNVKALLVLCLISFLIQVQQAVAYEPSASAMRKDVPDAYKWDLQSIFKSDEDWKGAKAQVQKGIVSLQRFDGNLSSISSIKASLDEYFSLRAKLDLVMLYANLKRAEDTSDDACAVMNMDALALHREFQSKSAFLREYLLKMTGVRTGEILSDSRMSKYSGYIQNLRRRSERFLGQSEEKILSLANDNLWAESDLNEMPSDVENIFKAAVLDMKFPTIKDENGKDVRLAWSSLSKYRASIDRRVRKDAVWGFFGSLQSMKDVFAAILAAEVKRDVFFAKSRGYESAARAYLDRENLDSNLIEDLIKNVRNNIAPLRRYIALRKRILNISEVHTYDLNVPLITTAERKIPYDEAFGDVVASLSPLGEAYEGVLSKEASPGGGWVDAYPSKSKESGAYSVAKYGVHPFVLMNYLDTVGSEFTLAHELGHAMHSYLNMKANGYESFGYSSLVAEIASTFNEMMLINHLLEKYKFDDEMKLFLLGLKLESIRTTIYRQAMFAEFEKKIHELAQNDVPITSSLLEKTYADLVKFYYGTLFVMDDVDQVEWASIPHFYWKFYVHSYAQGLAASIAMSQDVIADKPGAKERYLDMLKRGIYENPVAVVAAAGVDLKRPDAIRAAAKLMDDTITQIEGILQKKGFAD